MKTIFLHLGMCFQDAEKAEELLMKKGEAWIMNKGQQDGNLMKFRQDVGEAFRWQVDTT